MSNILKGTGASVGIACAKAFVLKKPTFNITDSKTKDPSKEIKAIDLAFSKSIEQLEKIKEIAVKKIGTEKALVFDAHIEIVKDPELKNQIVELIDSEKVNGAYAIKKVYDTTHDFFASMEDAYFKERASDINDVQSRVLANFLGVELPNLLSIDKEVIIVAHDLTPSETALLNKDFVKGFITNIGGRTSHAAIMARTMEIPAVLGLKNVTELIKDNQVVALDGDSGVVEYKDVDVNLWKKKILAFEEEKKELLKFTKVKAKTKDGHIVDVEANIGKPSDSDNLDSYGAEGVGLYRSEFLYMDSSNWPDEDTQFEAYKYVLEKQKDKIVIVRTLDIGGDKKLNYFTFDHEENPFLGYRAIRFTLDNKDVFKTQLRALLRASVYGKLGIMFPMICSIGEIIKAKEILNECKKELDKQKVKYSNDLKIGMMIEIPSTAILADKFAEHVDFFSIGTNDLIQYTFAVDRMSEKLTHLYQPNNPSLLKMIAHTIEGAKKHNVSVAMCGEMAGDVMSIPILLGLAGKGLNAFSMSASSIPRAKKFISSLNHKDCIELAEKAINCSTPEEVNKLVKDFLTKNNLM